MGNCCLKANKTKKGYSEAAIELPGVSINQEAADEHTRETQEALNKYFLGAVNGKKAEENIFV